MAGAAQDWLDSLDMDQRLAAVGPPPGTGVVAEAERTRWFYTPPDHGGLTFHRQRPAQHRLVMRLLASGLSEAGYTTVATVLGLENVLDRVEGFSVNWGRERTRDPGMYYLRVFGEPGGPQPWGWRFGGHHVSLNNLVVDGRVVATTPCFLGADPAMSPLLGGATLRPLGTAEDPARELVRSLRPELAARAVLLARAPNDIMAANTTRIGDRMVKRRELWRQGQHTPDRAEEPASGLHGADRQALALQRDLVAAVFADAGWEVPGMLAAMRDEDDVYFDGVSQIHLPRWSSGRVALVGDAAYAPSFLTGQGTSLALVGAYMLAGSLADRDHAAGFAAYERDTRDFVTANQELAGKGGATLFPTTAQELEQRNNRLRSLNSPPPAGGRPAHSVLALPEFMPVT